MDNMSSEVNTPSIMRHISHHWWGLALRGLIAILFGLITFIWPWTTLQALILLFGAFIFVDGVSAVIGAIILRNRIRKWNLLIIEGMLGIIIGILVMNHPATTAIFFVVLLAIWAIITGILEITAAIYLRKMVAGEWLLATAGVLSVGFGILLLITPTMALIIWTYIIGIYALIFGISMLSLGIKLKDSNNRFLLPGKDNSHRLTPSHHS